MKLVRKSIALLLALVMVLALGTTAFAAPVTYLAGASLSYTVPSSASLNQNIQAGSVTKNVGETGFYQRLPRLTHKCANCGYILTEDIPDDYRVSSTVGYTLSNPSILKDCEFTLAYASNFSGYETWPCLEFDYTAAKPGTTTVTLKFYYNFNAAADSGYCPYCGNRVTVPSNYNWYYDIVTFTVHVDGEEETDYVLTYDTNGGKEANWTDTQTTTADYADFTVSSTVPTRDGYTFLGWADAATATQSSYQADDTLRLTKSTPTKTIYAVWQKNVEKYTVEFQYPAGTTVETLEVEQGQTVTTLGEEKFYDGAYDETYNWKLTGWQDQNGATYGLLEDITVNGNLVLTPVVDQALLLCDGPTGNVMGVLFESDYTAGRNDLLAGTLSYTSPMTAAVAPGGDKGFAVNGTRKTVFGMEQDVDYTFAGWFFAPGQGTDNAHLNWTADNNVGTADLFHGDELLDNRIYAYWIYADYCAAQIGYQSNSLRATNVYINATVPDDIFHHYGFVVSTAATENDEDNLVIGGVIGGKKVGNYQKETVYETFCAAPIYEEEYTAQDFNSGLPGYDANRTGYITYFYWRNMQLKNASGDFTTLSARAYYQTLEGTVVYGDMSQVTFEPNNIYNPMFGGSDF